MDNGEALNGNGENSFIHSFILLFIWSLILSSVRSLMRLFVRDSINENLFYNNMDVMTELFLIF